MAKRGDDDDRRARDQQPRPSAPGTRDVASRRGGHGVAGCDQPPVSAGTGTWTSRGAISLASPIASTMNSIAVRARACPASAGACRRTGTSRVDARRARSAARRRRLRSRQAFGGDREPPRRLVGVHDLQAIDVLDDAGRGLARERAAVADHVDLERIAQAQRDAPPPRRCATSSAEVDERARPEHAPPHRRARRSRCASAFSRRVADQPVRIAHLVHHLVAAVDAGGAADALVLQALADVDAGRAHLHADRCSRRSRRGPPPRGSDLAAARAARLAARRVVGDDQRVLVEHHALEARVRAHVLADLLAHAAGVAVGREAVEEHPERSPTARAAR